MPDRMRGMMLVVKTQSEDNNGLTRQEEDHVCEARP